MHLVPVPRLMSYWGRISLFSRFEQIVPSTYCSSCSAIFEYSLLVEIAYTLRCLFIDLVHLVGLGLDPGSYVYDCFVETNSSEYIPVTTYFVHPPLLQTTIARMTKGRLTGSSQGLLAVHVGGL